MSAGSDERRRITGLVLAGGLGRRMSSDGLALDKALRPFAGRPMLAHVIERLSPQVGALLLNANGPPERYAGFGLPIIADVVGAHPGPLAGIHAGLCALDTEWLLTVPCDAPFLPCDLADRLLKAAADADRKLAVARCRGRDEPVFLLAHRQLRDDLAAFLSSGRRKVDAWYEPHGPAHADFDDDQAFRNLNTPEDLRRWEIR